VISIVPRFQRDDPKSFKVAQQVLPILRPIVHLAEKMAALLARSAVLFRPVPQAASLISEPAFNVISP
jgi:hypothetical protein